MKLISDSMIKGTLLYASPFPPMKSGISDYSIKLVSYLKKYFDITLYIEDYILTDRRLYEQYHVVTAKEEIDPKEYNYRLYNFGNNPEFHSYIYSMAIMYPGTIILHDVSLYYLFVGFHQRVNDLCYALYMNEGIDTFIEIKEIIQSKGNRLLELKENAGIFSLNRELLSSGNRIMVHSLYAYERVKQYSSNTKIINHIPLISANKPIATKEKLYSKYGIPNDAFVFASFGTIAITKLNREICSVFKRIADVSRKRMIYLMVGEGSYADSYIDDIDIFRTGFTTIEEFDSFIDYADVILNLRNPSMGETSGTMLRVLQKGKPCITNNGGWFSELPDESVYKIDLEQLDQELEFIMKKMVDDELYRKMLGEKAKEYFEKEYDADAIAEQIFHFVIEEPDH